ncbi:membrane protein [Microbacterium testaceum]|uniref:Membrane protein n=1 Tax=Microbacterium testaceum TaxID=2033 RepID=A0A4Y3QI88_MICTE|nr:hypothetical protein [Microbacterium testaceum]GEB44393.1 membrane protein [Microbacterium testaceum]
MKTPRLPTRLSGSTLVVASTGVAGLFGYAIQTVAGAGLEASAYAHFSVFWAAVFLAVGSMSGVQQEVTRAARPGAQGGEAGRRLLIGVLAVAVTAAALVVASGALWAGVVFADDGGASLALLSVAVLFSGAVAGIAGVLYGLHDWRRVALVISLDPALRFLMVGGSLVAGHAEWLPTAIVAPIPVTFVSALLLVIPRLRQGVTVDVATTRHLVGNISRAIVGAAATAVLVSALPLFIGAAARDISATQTGALLFNLTLTRAPIVIPALAFQSLLVVFFRDRLTHVARSTLLMTGGAVAVALLVAIVCGILGPTVIGGLFGDGYRLSGLPLAFLVASSGLTAGLSVTGAATIALRRHTAYLGGWVFAALAAVVLLFVSPGDTITRSVVALSFGPALGLLVHVTAIWRARSSSRV